MSLVHFASQSTILLVCDVDESFHPSTSDMHRSTAGEGHHKSEATLEKRNVVLRCYYAVPFLFAYCCVGAELFYVLLYVMHFAPHPVLHQVR